MRIQSSIAALNSHRQLGFNSYGEAKSAERQISGYHANHAADDAVDLEISEKARTQIYRRIQENKNIEENTNLPQADDNFLDEMTNKIPGDYQTIEEFVKAHRAAFASAGFILSHANGCLVVTTIQGGEYLTLSPSAVSRNPSSLRNMLGLSGTNTDVDYANADQSAPESRDKDADMAIEHMKTVKEQVLTQPSAAMMAQANALPQTVLQLLE